MLSKEISYIKNIIEKMSFRGGEWLKEGKGVDVVLAGSRTSNVGVVLGRKIMDG